MVEGVQALTSARWFRVGTQSGPPGDGGGERDGGSEVASEPVVAGCDAPEVLQSTKHALDGVAGAVASGVKGMRMLACWLVGDEVDPIRRTVWECREFRVRPVS